MRVCMYVYVIISYAVPLMCLFYCVCVCIVGTNFDLTQEATLNQLNKRREFVHLSVSIDAART